MIVFDPVDGLLQLRRWVLSAGVVRDTAKDLMVMGGMTSVSLPLGLGLGVPSSTSPRYRGRRMTSGGMSPDMAGGAVEGAVQGSLMAVKESVVATWHLKRSKDWTEVRKRLEEDTDDPRAETEYVPICMRLSVVLIFSAAFCHKRNYRLVRSLPEFCRGLFTSLTNSRSMRWERTITP